LIGQRPALKLQEVRAIRIRLQLSKNIQELVIFNHGFPDEIEGEGYFYY